MAVLRINESRLRQIKKRQWGEPRWGKDYLPAQLANPKEAPSGSHAVILSAEKLGGRSMHLMSMNESWVALLALYHPQVWDIHEQKVLFPQPCPHPLQGHKRAQGMNFPPFRGTVAVAERLGMLSRHKRCRVKLADGDTSQAWFPYIGDLLVFLEDAEGLYAVNLNIKDKEDSFRRVFPREGRACLDEDDDGVLNRHALEREYYADAGIPTRQVVGRHINEELRNNLFCIFQFHREKTSLSKVMKEGLWEFFSSHIGTTRRVCDLIQQAAGHLALDPYEVNTVFHQGVWNRKILVDLMRPVLTDRPLRPMQVDAVDVYRDWFRRG